jgi:hypothetical protein
MAEREITFGVPQDLFDESLKRLRAAGVKAPEELLEAALRASAIDALATTGGSGPVPTALSDVRAARLLEICKLRNEIPSDEVVAVLFRIMPSTAATVTRHMQATYEAALAGSLRAHMIAVGKLTAPKKEEGEPALHRATFETPAAYAQAVKAIAAAGLTGEVSEEPAARSLVFPQKVEADRNGPKQSIQIAKDILGITKKP